MTDGVTGTQNNDIFNFYFYFYFYFYFCPSKELWRLYIIHVLDHYTLSQPGTGNKQREKKDNSNIFFPN